MHIGLMLLRLLLIVLGTHEVGFLPRITIFVIDLIVVELLFIVYGTSSCHTKCFIIDFDLHFFPVVIIKIGLFICTELILRCSCLLLWNLFMVPMNPSKEIELIKNFLVYTYPLWLLEPP